MSFKWFGYSGETGNLNKQIQVTPKGERENKDGNLVVEQWSCGFSYKSLAVSNLKQIALLF